MKNSKRLFLVILCMLCLVISYRIGHTRGYSLGKMYSPELFEMEYNLFKTVAHIDLSKYEEIELIYYNTDKDIAYYMYTGERPWISVEDSVLFRDGTSSVVLGMDVYGFTVTDNPNVTFGFSGSAVYDVNMQQIGYVSERLPNGNIYCIWI